ncbi:hypothetical protein Pryu01_00624 [Paraliobacillus ryukyuensis]|uniref:Putative PurR-regulated permease PerM n=1 Tax=Paraliobacillus ryukyuensis TaxID=200904 RepID=A0A366EHX3_9BACI|nr:AI-2E family transporter [Paraliobacillus ryukyuensis]RBP01310.1 putative PurR-regulated permease PerM [Paraliobacillus ryukyuensis]
MLSKTKIKQWLMILILGIACLLFIFLLYLLFPFYQQVLRIIFQVLTPFIIASLIAYLLHPIIEKLHGYHIPRALAIICIYLTFFGGIGLACYSGFPSFIKQMKDLQQSIPHFFDTYRTTIYQLYENTAFLPETFHDQMDQFINKLEENIGVWVTSLLGEASKLMDMIMLIAVIPVLVFYMLKDFHIIQSSIINLFPKKTRPKIKAFWPAIDEGLGSYIRGQLIVCFFIGLTSYLVLLLIQMKYPLVLAIIMAITNIIPYFGPIIGAFPAVIIALTISTKQVLLVIGAVLLVQIIEGNLLSPFIVGRSVHLHPIMIILILLIGGEIAGILGMIIAIPIATVVKVIIQRSKQGKKTAE